MVGEIGVVSSGCHQIFPIALATMAPMKQMPQTVMTATTGGQVMVTTMTPASREITRVTSPSCHSPFMRLMVCT